jgi:hypothetical protein
VAGGGPGEVGAGRKRRPWQLTGEGGDDGDGGDREEEERRWR